MLSRDFTPNLARLHACLPERYPFFLQSVHPAERNSRYDILFAFPGRRLYLTADGRLYLDREEQPDADFLDRLDQWWQAERLPVRSQPDGGLPFLGGWFVYLAYDLVHQIEPRLGRITATGNTLPVAGAVRVPAAIINDYQQLKTYLICEPAHEHRLGQLSNDLDRIGAMRAHYPCAGARTIEEEDPQQFLNGVATVQNYIRDGDVFQVNLSRLWRAVMDNDVPASDVYRRLCASNPAPFAGIMQWSEHAAVLSSSPERLVQISGRRVCTRPIAGTHPRVGRHRADINQAQRLLEHPKERAEHVMLIDLERNDLGRVCEIGSIRVSELMHIESYRHVHHIVSEVQGRLSDGTAPGQVMRAVFPGGTITGCPKVRCMEIIQQLERQARGAYTGSMGYLNRNGDLDMNILIRSMTWRPGEIEFRAGAGIVADSQPGRELAETRSKAEGLLRALH